MNGLLPAPGFLRFLLAFVVVVHHSVPLRMGAWAVYVFFILSGYWIARIWEEKYAKAQFAPLTFLCSRWWRLAPVFFVSLALAFVSSSIVTGAPQLPSNIIEWTIRQLPIIGSKSAGSILPPTWSLDVEMQFYVSFAVLMVLGSVKKRWLVNSLIAVLAVVSLALVVVELTRGLIGSHRSSLSIYFWLFAIGIWIHKADWSPSVRLAKSSAALFLGVTLIFLLWPYTRSAIWMRGGAELAPLIVGSNDPRWIMQSWWVVGAVVFVPLIAWNVHQKSGAIDRMLGNWAYPLYLFHWVPRDWYYSKVNWAAPIWQNGLLLLINFTAALLGSWLILRFIDRPIDRLRARWVERRRSVPKVQIDVGIESLSSKG